MMQFPMGVLADKQMKTAMSLNVLSTILYWGSVALIGMTRNPPWQLWIS